MDDYDFFSGNEYALDPDYFYNDTSGVDEAPWTLGEELGFGTGDFSWAGGPGQDNTNLIDWSTGNFGDWKDIGQGVYSDGKQYLLPNGAYFNGTDWENMPDASGGSSTWSKLLGNLATPNGILSGLKALAGIGGIIQGSRNINQLRQPISAPQMTGSRAQSLAPVSFGTPQARSWQGVMMAKGGPLRAASETGAIGRPAAGMLRGPGGGQDDTVPVKASHGEYVMDADTVSALGDGNTEAGAKKLDQMRQNIRAHKRSAPVTKIPPKAKAPEKYMKGGK